MPERGQRPPFADFDLSRFWEETGEYSGGRLTPALVDSVEAELGVKLPVSYVALMATRNGGVPRNTCFPTTTRTSWAEDHVALTGIFGIGRQGDYSLCGTMGARFWRDEWGYPDWGLCICDCPSAGHDMILLDYRERSAEPRVVHVDQERDYEVTFIADDFESFIRGLVNESTFDPSDEEVAAELAATLKVLETGSFSTRLSKLIRSANDAPWDTMLRRLLCELTQEKGCFCLHGDARSQLVYDVLFHLHTQARKVRRRSAYLKVYEDLLAFGDGEITTSGYAPDFVEGWFDRRAKKGVIVTRADGCLEFTPAFADEILKKLRRYR